MPVVAVAQLWGKVYRWGCPWVPGNAMRCCAVQRSAKWELQLTRGRVDFLVGSGGFGGGKMLEMMDEGANGRTATDGLDWSAPAFAGFPEVW